jgi:hypothetical protein
VQAYTAARQLSLDELDLLNELLDARDEARARSRRDA